jgi:hypothetical protein
MASLRAKQTFLLEYEAAPDEDARSNGQDNANDLRHRLSILDHRSFGPRTLRLGAALRPAAAEEDAAATPDVVALPAIARRCENDNLGRRRGRGNGSRGRGRRKTKGADENAQRAGAATRRIGHGGGRDSRADRGRIRLPRPQKGDASLTSRLQRPSASTPLDQFPGLHLSLFSSSFALGLLH